MSEQNVPESVPVDANLVELGVLHSLTKGIIDGVGIAMQGMLPMTLMVMAGAEPSPKDFDQAMNTLVKALHKNMELAELIEKHMPFHDADLKDLTEEEKDALKVAVKAHPVMQEAMKGMRESEVDKVNRMKEEIRAMREQLSRDSRAN